MTPAGGTLESETLKTPSTRVSFSILGELTQEHADACVLTTTVTAGHAGGSAVMTACVGADDSERVSG